MAKYKPSILQRILLGDNPHELIGVASDGHDGALRILEEAARSTAANAGESLESFTQNAGYTNQADQVLAALAVAKHLSSKSRPGTDIVTAADLLKHVKEMADLPVRKRFGMARELNRLVDVLEAQGAQAHAVEDALRERVIQLEGNYRYKVWRSFENKTKWCPPSDKIYGLVKEELTLGDNLVSYPLFPQRAHGEYMEQFLERHFEGSLVTRIREREIDKDRLMMGAFATLADSVENIAQARMVTLNQWEAALKRSHGAQEWKSIYDSCLALDHDLEAAVRQRQSSDVAAYQKHVNDILELFERHPRVSRGKRVSISSKSQYDQQMQKNAQWYEKIQKEGNVIFAAVSGPSKIVLDRGVYAIYTEGSWDRKVYALQLTGERRRSVVKYTSFTSTLVMENLPSFTNMMNRDEGVWFPSFEDLIKYAGMGSPDFGKGVTPIENVEHYHPEFDKEIAARKLYHEHMAKRFASA